MNIKLRKRMYEQGDELKDALGGLDHFDMAFKEGKHQSHLKAGNDAIKRLREIAGKDRMLKAMVDNVADKAKKYGDDIVTVWFGKSMFDAARMGLEQEFEKKRSGR